MVWPPLNKFVRVFPRIILRKPPPTTPIGQDVVGIFKLPLEIAFFGGLGRWRLLRTGSRTRMFAFWPAGAAAAANGNPTLVNLHRSAAQRELAEQIEELL